MDEEQVTRWRGRGGSTFQAEAAAMSKQSLESTCHGAGPTSGPAQLGGKVHTNWKMD